MTRFELRYRRQGPRDHRPLVDAPHARARSGPSPGRVDQGEVIGAVTAMSMLARALHHFGLEVETRGWTLLVRLPGGDGEPTARTVALGHHPGDAGRLWWWVRGMTLHAIGPSEEVATVADQIVRLLRADGDSYRESEDKGQ
jgi:hypothetical protein